MFIFFLLLAGSLISVSATFEISLSSLPSYQNTTNFRLYYTYFSTDGNIAVVNLYVQKEGKDWRQTVDKNKTTVSGYFQLEGSDLYDNEGRYNFYATAVVGSQTVNSAAVTTILDMSAPSAPTEYGKERVNPTTYKLSWKNSFDEDFGKVYVYRSKETSFTADSGTRIGEAGGAKDEKMIYNDGSVEQNVEYFYALRAVDHAGNASGTVTDAPGTIVIVSVTKTPAVESLIDKKVKILPTEEDEDEESIEEGQISGGVSSEAGEVKGEREVFASKYKNWLITGGVGVILVAAYFVSKKRNK